MEAKGAIRMVPAKSTGGVCVARVWVRDRATAVPMDCAKSTIRSGGMPAVCVAKETSVRASVRSPGSEGQPVLLPKPR